MALSMDDLLASRIFPERAASSTMSGLTTSLATIDIPHKAVKKITCLGSGFVGGMKAFLDDALLHMIAAHCTKVLHPP